MWPADLDRRRSRCRCTVALSYSADDGHRRGRGVDDEEAAAAQRDEAVAAARVDDRADRPVDRPQVRVLARPARWASCRSPDRAWRRGCGRRCWSRSWCRCARAACRSGWRPGCRSRPAPETPRAPAACPVLPTVVSKHFSGVRASASKMTTWPLATNDRTAWVCSLLNRIMCGRTGFLPVAVRHRSRCRAAEIEPHGSAWPARDASGTAARLRRSGSGRRSRDGCRTDRRSRPRSRVCSASPSARPSSAASATYGAGIVNPASRSTRQACRPGSPRP